MISAIVLAAGLSKRMGKSKMLLPWGDTTVIARVITTLFEAGIIDINVVCGNNRDVLEKALSGFDVHYLLNPDYANGEMLLSCQIGLRNLPGKSEAAMIALGDQPQIETAVVKKIIQLYKTCKNKIVVPSYHMHRGHPWLIDRSLWNEVLKLRLGSTMRDFLNHEQDLIHYVNVDTPSVMLDLDTPEDYQHSKP